MSLRDQLLQAGQQINIATVDCTDLGAGKVRLRTLTGAMAESYTRELASTDYRATARSRAVLVQCCVVDDAGSPVFTQADVAEISQWNHRLLDRVFFAAFEHNQLGKEQQVQLEGN